jgi:hypothetical protein
MKCTLAALAVMALVIGALSMLASFRFFAGTKTGDIALGAVGLVIGSMLFAAGSMSLDLIAGRQPNQSQTKPGT